MFSFLILFFNNVPVSGRRYPNRTAIQLLYYLEYDKIKTLDNFLWFIFLSPRDSIIYFMLYEKDSNGAVARRFTIILVDTGLFVFRIASDEHK